MYHFNQFHIPQRMTNAIHLYVDRGVPPGGFLSSVICNNLFGAVQKEDDKNLVNLPAFVDYFYNQTPANCWGSRETMKEWIASFK